MIPRRRAARYISRYRRDVRKTLVALAGDHQRCWGTAVDRAARWGIENHNGLGVRIPRSLRGLKSRRATVVVGGVTICDALIVDYWIHGPGGEP